MTEGTDPESLVARAIESVLEAMPVTEEELPEALVKYQPWADTAAPQGRNKRPLQELLDEIAERVASEPQARAAVPAGKRPGLAFFDRFVPRRGAAAEGEPGRGRAGRSKRRRGRGGGEAARPPEATGRAPQAGGAGQGRAQPRQGRQESAAAGQGGPGTAAGTGAGGGRRKRRRGGGRGRGGGGGGGGAGAGGGAAPAAP